MYRDGKRAIVVALTLIAITIVTVTIAFNYKNLVKHISSPSKPAPSPIPFKPMVNAYHSANISALPPSFKEKVVKVALSSDAIKSLLAQRKYIISGVIPWMDERGSLIGGCVIVSFHNPQWVELDTRDPNGKPLKYVGWARQLTICVDIKSGKVAGINPSLSTRNVPRELPKTLNPQIRETIMNVLEVAKKFLYDRYGLREDEVNLTFYGILNNVAVVLASPKTRDKLYRVEILMKIDTKNMEVIEAYKYIPKEIYINPKYVNTTITVTRG